MNSVLDPLVREADAMRFLIGGGAAGVPPTPSLSPIEEEHNGPTKTPGSGDEAKLNLTSLAGLLKEPEEKVTWILDGILPAEGLSLMAGKPKAGKSTFARCLALAVAQGQPFMNRATVKGTVLYLALEEKRSEVK